MENAVQPGAKKAPAARFDPIRFNFQIARET
jgi:hypothetical protein